MIMLFKQTKLKNRLSALFFLNFIFSLIFSANFAFAAQYDASKDQLGGLDKAGKESGYNTTNKDAAKNQIADIVGNVIGVILSLVGIIFFILMLMGSLDIIGANGNEEMLKKGKERIKNGFIGILVVFAAYAFAISIIGLATGGGSVFKP